jgi:hypothetical protein
MDGYAACNKCGLRAVRYELERRGILLRFCDTCYWGEVSADERPAGAGMEEKPDGSTSGEAPAGEIRGTAAGAA